MVVVLVHVSSGGFGVCYRWFMAVELMVVLVVYGSRGGSSGVWQ